jgi:hypothetical protein
MVQPREAPQSRGGPGLGALMNTGKSEEVMRKDEKGVEFLENDIELIRAMKTDLRFRLDPELDSKRAEDEKGRDPNLFPPVALSRYERIEYFREQYEATDQDTVAWAPEFVIVTRMIMEGKRPVKLRWLTDFDGEEK